MTFCFEIQGREEKDRPSGVVFRSIKSATRLRQRQRARTFIYDEANRQSDSVNASVARPLAVRRALIYITLRNKARHGRNG